MSNFFQTLLTTSFHGSIVILVVLLLRLVLRKAPKKFICMLWMLAGIRLLLPIPIESAFSLQPPAIQITIPAWLSAVFPFVWVAIAVIIGAYSVASYIHLRRKVLDAVKVPGGWTTGSKPPLFWGSSSRKSTFPPACPGKPANRSLPTSGPIWTREITGSK